MTGRLHHGVEAFFEEHHIGRAPLIVAVSGGGDSTALLLVLQEAGFETIVAAHVSHHLRGDESDGDEAFVRELCRVHGIELHVLDGTLDSEVVRHSGVEAAARTIRYQRLQELKAQIGATCIATAHHQRDQVETILMRLLTTTSLRGLRGIQPVRGDGVIRPFLHAAAKEIQSYLAARRITARSDSSNSDPRFLRNRLRALLPHLGRGTERQLLEVAGQCRSVIAELDALLDLVEDRLQVIEDSQATTFPDWPPEAWLREALLHRHVHRLDPGRHVGRDDLARLAARLPGLKRTDVTQLLELVPGPDGVILRHRRSGLVSPSWEHRLEEGETVQVESLTIGVAIAGDRPTAATEAAIRQRFQLPDGGPGAFTVRNRRPGDRFQPLGMRADKKLKDFLIDRKIAREVRDTIPLLLWNGTIVWVGGVEVSDRFKVTSPPGVQYEVWMESAGE